MTAEKTTASDAYGTREQKTRTFRYDAINRLSEVSENGKCLQKNVYDAEGLRSEMEENDKLVRFLYDGDKVVAERDDTKGLKRYIRGYELVSSDCEQARTYYHYASDELGSITDVLNYKGEVLNHYEYDAFGEFSVREEQVENRFAFAGEQFDPATNLYYLRARFYNPVIGRFIQEDTYYGDGLNLYAYCHNNPVGYVDPSGHICEEKYNAVESLREQDGSNAADALKKYKELREQGYTPEQIKNGDYKSGRATDFYVTPNGEVVPATGYRYMDSKYAEQTMESMSAPGSYFGFEKFNSASAAQDAFQISPEWSNCKLRGEFDTLQVIDEMYVPKAYGDKGPGLEPFTRCYPEYGKGGCQQFIYKGTIYFKNVDIIED